MSPHDSHGSHYTRRAGDLKREIRAGPVKPGPVKPEPVKIKNVADGQVEVWLSEPRRDLWLAAPPVAGWCFQRLGQETPNGRHSLRCHKDPKTCQTVRDASPGEMSSSCTFVAFIDKTGVQFQGTGTENSYYLYAKMPFASPFPSLP